MALQSVALSFLLVLVSLLAAEVQKEPDPTVQGVPRETATCQRPQWDSRLRLAPDRDNYKENEEVMLSCPAGFQPSFTHVKCVREDQSTPFGTPVYEEVWNGKLRGGGWVRIQSYVACVATCQRPQWDSRLRLAPEQDNYKENEEVILSCPAGFQPSFTHIKCVREDQYPPFGIPVYRKVWNGKLRGGGWVRIQSNVVCIATCQRPQWDSRLRLAPDQGNYKENEEVMLSCPEGFQPSFSHVKCLSEDQLIRRWRPVHEDLWLGRDSGGVWSHIQSNVVCVETCQKPRWDSRLRLAPDQDDYKKNEEVMLSCPEGFQPSFSHVKCLSEDQLIRRWHPVHQDLWLGRDSRGVWYRIQFSVECIEVLQVVPGTLDISSTSIKLNWTCTLPDACQHMRATCRAVPSSPPCEAEEVKGEEMLHGQEGTFTCPPLQPFTDYSVTISLPPSTILYTRLLRTKETVPDKPEQLWLDPSTGSLRWKALPSCKGEIVGYQLNITARRAQDGSFLEFKQVSLNQSVTQYTPPHQAPGSKYTVTVQGLTAAGAGAASLLEFQSCVSVAGQPLGPWPGSAVAVVVTLSLLVPLSAGILWFVLSRKRKALASKAEEDHYTELQPCENSDKYCVIKKTHLAEEDAGKGGQAGEPFAPAPACPGVPRTQ